MSKKEEFAKLWLDSGGFIPQCIAAEILDLKPPTINRMVKAGKLNAYKGQYPYLRDVLNYETSPQMKRQKSKEI